MQAEADNYLPSYEPHIDRADAGRPSNPCDTRGGLEEAASARILELASSSASESGVGRLP
jgi:hypothetical protein